MAQSLSMADVARHAGVHQTTVSLALRNDPRLPVTTRERIQNLARELGYRPNPLISALISGRKRRGEGRGNALAFLTSHRERGGWRQAPIYQTLFERLTEHADARGYSIEEFWLNEPGMTPERMHDILKHRAIRGVVVCPLEGKKHTLDFDFSPFASVALGYTLRAPLIDHVALDYGANMTLAIRKLLEADFQRILFVTAQNLDERVNHLSLGAYLVQRHLNPRQVLAPVVVKSWSERGIARRIKTARAEVILVSTIRESRHLKRSVGATCPVAVLDCHDPQLPPRGIIRSLDEEAKTAISLVTSQVEQARFGLPTLPRSILIAGQWSWGLYPNSNI